MEEYRKNLRDKKRIELGLNNKLIIGHVGRYCYIKNQLFLIDVFSKIKATRHEAHLLLIGKGEDEQKIRYKIHELNLEESVSLLIDRDDVAQLYAVFV